MKKIYKKNRDTNDFFDDNPIKDDKTIEDDEQYKRVKMFYDSLENCNKDMVYRDAKHWYVQID